MQGPRNTKTSNVFICTFFVDSFSNFYTFHDAWAHKASISIFPTNACQKKTTWSWCADKQQLLTQVKYVLYSHRFSQFLVVIFEYYISTLHGSCEK